MIKWLFGTPPAIGSTWNLDPSNPFWTHRVVVLDVKGGYVEYTYLWDTNKTYRHSRTIREFRVFFREVK